MHEFSVVIPLIPAHDRGLKHLFAILKREESYIKEVIIARSESKKYARRFLEYKFRRYLRRAHLDVELSYLPISSPAGDGINRNRGWQIASGEFVAFMDADDSYSANRLEILLYIFRNSRFSGLLHGYSLDFLEVEVQYQKDQVYPLELCYSKDQASFDTDKAITTIDGSSVIISHGHLTVKNFLKSEFQFTSIFPGADSELCKRLIQSEVDLGYLPINLSSWNRKRGSRYKLRSLRKKCRTYIERKDLNFSFALLRGFRS